MKVTQVALCPTEASQAAGRPALTPELLAASGARYSRNNEGLESISGDNNMPTVNNPAAAQRQHRIYVLCDSLNQEVRYVGITAQLLRKRLQKHIKLARDGKQLHCSNWIRTLMRQGLTPTITGVETTHDPLREIAWIKHYRELGCNLTHASDGGDGHCGFSHGEAVRQKIAAAGMQRYRDLTGQVFGRLSVVRLSDHKPVRWECLCSCGAWTIVKANYLFTGKTRSCGCLSRELAATRARNRARHGMWQSPEYRVWTEMIAKCHNPQHARYPTMGGRGILVCARWRESFENFFADVGTRPDGWVLNRKNKTAGFFIDNCHWTTRKEMRKKS